MNNILSKETIKESNIIKKEAILSWLYSLKIDSKNPLYYFFNGSDYNIFSSCFALFILDLFDQTKYFSTKEIDTWIKWIQKHQNPNNGYFFPKGINSVQYSKTVMQLTTFCLSALSILKSYPKYKLRFIDNWKNEIQLSNYLENKGCLIGAPGSGNFAMFVAIFLTSAYRLEQNNKYIFLLEKWFELHDNSQNNIDGFIGSYSINNPYLRIQNSFHQFVIYEFHNRPLKFPNLIIDNVLKVGDSEGHFAPRAGGGACFDYDAIHTLIKFGINRNYKTEIIKNVLKQHLESQSENQNIDNGFCESKQRPNNVLKIFTKKNIGFLLDSKSLNIFYQRLKNSILISSKSNHLINNHWSTSGKGWNQSDLWSTWFRCLAFAEITSLNTSLDNKFNFHRHIGLGYNKQNNHTG